ncbi:MAG TPA: amidase family protein [Solirubrobacteraceae bacterium]|nr:amidase family protein [Solirubrobacteraceae bacterium]
MTPLSGTDAHWTAAAIAEDVRSGRRSAVEVIDEALDRIAGANGALNAFCEVRPGTARVAAAALDAQIAAGEDLDPTHLPLAGVPVAVKDVIWEAGIEATDGSRSLLGFVPHENATVVQRLIAAGAIVVGRVNAPEFCYRGICANDLYGVTSNPWDLGRTPGGSSGGSGAAVAAGLVPLAIGTDGGGSIRIPSSFCGVAGFKATFGVVPREPQWPGWLTLTHVGPMAFTVEDCALMLSVMAGPDLRDPMSLPVLPRDPRALDRSDLRGLRVAYSEDLGYVPVDDGVRRAFRAAVERFAALGAELVAAQPAPFSPNPVDIWNTLTTTDNLASEGPLLETGRVGLDARGLIEPGAEVSGLEYVRMRNAQWEYACAWGRFMMDYDLLLTPTMECVAFEHGRTGPATVGGQPIGEFYDDFCHFCYPFNLTGQPAISVPMGTAEHDMPVGLQIVGRRFEDDLVLAAGAAWERLGGWPRAPREERPPLESEASATAGERIRLGGEMAEIRRVFSPQDGERVVEFEGGSRT